MENLEILIQNIEQWAEDRNLIRGSTPQKQMLKLMEEFGELCGGVAKNKPEVIKDSIGDCFVVMVILSNQIDVGDYVDFDADDIIQEYLDGKYSHTNVTEQLLEGIHSLGGLSLPISKGWKVQKEYIELFL